MAWKRQGQSYSSDEASFKGPVDKKISHALSIQLPRHNLHKEALEQQTWSLMEKAQRYQMRRAYTVHWFVYALFEKNAR
jgi:hypothetical protein